MSNCGLLKVEDTAVEWTTVSSNTYGPADMTHCVDSALDTDRSRHMTQAAGIWRFSREKAPLPLDL
jgi:hypothetical protein